MSSRLQNGGDLKENYFSTKLHDGFWIFWGRMIQKTLIPSLSYGFLQIFHFLFIITKEMLIKLCPTFSLLCQKMLFEFVSHLISPKGSNLSFDNFIKKLSSLILKPNFFIHHCAVLQL